jgi:putative transposase
MPAILNSDQDSQFTSFDFTEQLKKNEIRIGIDGRGRAMGDIFTERLWRSVKDEEVYLKNYQSVWEA